MSKPIQSFETLEQVFYIDGYTVTEEYFNSVINSAVYSKPESIVEGTPDIYGFRPHTDWFTESTFNGESHINFLVYSSFSYLYLKTSEDSHFITKETVDLQVFALNLLNADGLEPNQTLINKATSKLFRTSQRHYELDVGVEIATMKQNLSIIKDTLETIRAAKRALRNGNFQQVSKLLKVSVDVVSAPWLLYRYGFKPLLASIQSLSLDLNRDHMIAMTKVKSFSANVWDEKEIKNVNQVHDRRFDHNLSIKSKSFVKHSLECLRTLDELEDASDVISWLNPVAIVWELIPYSFVIDWFIDLGSFFEQFSVDYTIQGLHSSTTTGCTFIAECAPVWLGDEDFNGTIDLITGVSASCKTLGVHFTRENLNGRSPALLPTFNIELSTEQLLDSVALLLQRMK